jgi:hypothetical protein
MELCEQVATGYRVPAVPDSRCARYPRGARANYGKISRRARFALGPKCGTRSDLSLSKQSAHATFLCRFLPMVAVMQTTEARA